MKKIISMLLVIAMVITVLTVSVATTSAAETATITIYGLDGTTEVKEINVGDEFTVYTTLNVSDSVTNGMIGSIQGSQTYSTGVLSLVDEVSGQYGELADLVKVFPVTGASTITNAATAGTINYNASNPSTSNAFKFDSDSSLLIVTTYKVTAAGTGEVKNSLKNLAAADSALTRIVFEGKTQEGKSFAGKATFDDPTPAIDHAEVRIHSLDGSVETKSFNVGDTFVAYTMLDASSVNDGKMGSINGTQKYTTSVLELADTVDADGMIADTAKVFPIMKNSAMANAKEAGTIKYAGSSISGFLFNSNKSQLITTTYKVVANGYADITNKLIVLAAADEDITRIVFNGETQKGMSYDMPASFTTDGPIPTEPTPTQPQPTTPSDKLKVTIINPDKTTVSKEFKVNDTFTVYTVLNINGNAASIDGSQTYSADKLQLTDKVSGEYNEVVDLAAMFPILGNETIAGVNNGVIKFNATRGAVGGGYTFNSATSKLIVTNYKVTATGEATVKTALKTLIKDDENLTKVVYNGATQSGQTYSMPGSFTDPGAPEPTQPSPTTPAPTTPTPTTPTPTQPANTAKVTIYGIDGKSATKTYNVGDTFTVYTTFNAGDTTIASLSATQTFTSSVLQSADTVDSIGVIVDNNTVFPILKDKAVGKVSTGLIKYNGSTPGLGTNGFAFNSDDSLLIVTKYKVIAAGNAEVRNALTTVGAADVDLTRIVDKGEVQPGFTVGGTASFTDPTQPYVPTEPTPTQPTPTQPTPGDKYLLGDADNNDGVDSIDITLIKRYVAFMDLKNIDIDILERNADVDGNGLVEILDATYVQRYIAFMDVKYPVDQYIPIN